jgi:hypothetical protein
VVFQFLCWFNPTLMLVQTSAATKGDVQERNAFAPLDMRVSIVLLKPETVHATA